MTAARSGDGSARSRLVLPLDVPDLPSASRLIDSLADDVGVFKVGLELFTATGPAAVEAVHEAGGACFLDLKLHDIPKTMASAARAAANLGVRYLTVHASAGRAALEACAEATEGTGTQLLAVTVLTSLDDALLRGIGLAGPTQEAALRLGALATAAGIDGLVCSPHECFALREALGDEIVLMVPGVRPRGSAAGDQRRVATPTDALAAGASLLVVGRPIREAPDPRAAARAIVAEIARAGRR